MRRLIAISLLLLAGMPSIVSLFAADTDADLNLPACCRRNGTHHCQMNLQAAQFRQDHAGHPQISAESKH